MKNDLISIIIPVYKVEKYLEKCVNSILHQTYQNIEIILVDDGSPDNSGKLCEKLKNKDSRIIVLHKDNGGLSDARNYGLQYAHGSLVMFVDSDDYIHANMVEIMYEKMNLDGTDLVICDYCKVDQFGKSLENKNKKDMEILKKLYYNTSVFEVQSISGSEVRQFPLLKILHFL